MKHINMELLAPAGSKEGFISALRAGADSVYLGVDKYNARLKSDKLSLYDLEVAVDYAHSRDKKVYLALNTLIKHGEMDEVVKILYRINRFKPDALIVQDTGAARVIREQFPEIPIHGSTQMSVHNSYGVEVLSRLGFKRVILARELSLPELKLIARKSPVGLEVFCHGALCFCISGMCLFSSLIGAHSGNRGRCTQPCRRLWAFGPKRGYFFSPKDLQVAKHVNTLKKIGITSLKIEGRMRSAEYAYNAVKAYRLLIDADESGFTAALAEAEKILSADFARDKTTFLLSGKDSSIFEPFKAQCLGRKIGTVTGHKGGIISIKTTEPLRAKDRIRISDPQRDITKSFKISGPAGSGKTCDIPYTENIFAAGSQVFKAGDAGWDEKDIKKEVDGMYSSYTGGYSELRDDYSNKYTALIARQWMLKDTAPAEQLWVRIDDPGWFELIPEDIKNLNIVLSLNRENIHNFKETSDTVPFNRKNIVCELTPYIGQREIPGYQKIINDMTASGINRWVLNNISQFGYFSTPGIEKTAGHFLYMWNAFSARTLKDLGASYFVTSWEDDFLNIRKLGSSGLRKYLIVYLYGYPPVVRSRMLTKDTYAGDTFSQQDTGLKIVYESGSGILIPDKPVMLFNARKKLAGTGIRNFGIDLSYINPGQKIWKDIYGAYNKESNFPDSIKFNFKRTVK
jgi:putative protease